MALEDDIKQSKFHSEKQKLVVNLLYTYHHTLSKLGEVIKQKDITRQQYNVLRILRGQYPNSASINLIKERMLDKMSDASRIVERLKAKDLIEKQQCKEDRRSAEIKISEKGLSMLEMLDPKVEECEKQIVKLNDAETQQLNSLLDKFRGSKP